MSFYLCTSRTCGNQFEAEHATDCDVCGAPVTKRPSDNHYYDHDKQEWVEWDGDSAVECGQLRAEIAVFRAHLEAVRDYVENPKAVSAEDMTDAEKVNGMWSQAVAALGK